MGKEGEPIQSVLFAGELLEAPLPACAETIPTLEIKTASEAPLPPVTTIEAIEPVLVVHETSKPTIRDLRAVRSLLYNRLLLEVVQRRIEKAETILLSYLLTQGSSMAQIGPYLVELDESDYICVTQTEANGWFQTQFSELGVAITV
jgi:hypothetical protein